MITKTQLRERIDAAYPSLKGWPLDYAIKKVREYRAAEAEYYAIVGRSHDGEDEAYEQWRDQNQD